MCSEASTGVGLGGCGIFPRLLARASSRERLNSKDWSRTTKQCCHQELGHPGFGFHQRRTKGCCKINFKSTLIGSNQDRARDLADQDSCQYVVGNGGRDAGHRTKELVKIGNGPEKEAFGKGPRFVLQRSRRSGRK